MITIAEARELILNRTVQSKTKLVHLTDSLGRVLAEDVYTDRDYPPFNRSAVDGYGISLTDFLDNGIQKYTLVGQLMAGSEFLQPLRSGECIKIMTGASVPTSVDAIVKVEDSIADGMTVELRPQSVKPFLNIALRGEDSKKNQMIIQKGTLISPLQLSLLAAVGKSEIKVFTPLSVAIVSTGDELTTPGHPVKDYQIRDSNSYSLQGFLDYYKIPVHSREIVSDDTKKLSDAFEKAQTSDIVIFTGGVSMGDADYVPAILKKAGVKEVFHKVKLKPGKPIWFGVKGEQLVFGLPGNPLSVMVGFKIFIEPSIRMAMAMTDQQVLKLPLGTKKPKKVNLDEYFPCRFSIVGQSRLESVKSNGSGDFTSVLLSDGIALHPIDSADLEEDTLVDFILWRSIR